jgi:hypothetical protein
MNRRPGQVDVITEVGYCPSCGRTRNLRREEHHLGALVRTIVTCETCHRTLSSSVGVAAAEPVQASVDAPPAPVAKVAAPERAAQPAARKPAAKKPAVKKPAAKKPPAKKPAVKKPASRSKAKPTAARKTTRTK